ncbi:MAG: hypothetical protein VX944_12955 [Myxococcota bacterium]|nr:hypothetical protein [Myxococcota bacterium]
MSTAAIRVGPALRRIARPICCERDRSLRSYSLRCIAPESTVRLVDTGSALGAARRTRSNATVGIGARSAARSRGLADGGDATRAARNVPDNQGDAAR